MLFIFQWHIFLKENESIFRNQEKNCNGRSKYHFKGGFKKNEEFIFNRLLFYCGQTNESCKRFEIQLIEFTGLGPKRQLIIHLQ